MLSIPANETVSYQLQVTKGGKYLLKFAYTNNGEAVKLNDVLDVFVGVGQVGIDDSVVLESGSGLETVAFQVGIPTGDISFDLTSKSDADIQWDSFTPGARQRARTWSTTSPPAASARWKAKTMWTLPPACAMRTSRTTDQGQPGRCLSNMRAGSRANYKLNVEETGTYRMVVHYAAVGETALNTTATFLINNITQAFDEGISFKNTAISGNTYYNFVDLEPLTVILPSGEADAHHRIPDRSLPEYRLHHL